MQEQTNQFPAASPESNELFQLMIENITDYAIFMTNTDGQIISWNPGVERLFGYAETEIVGQPISLIFTPEDAAAGAHLKEMERAARDGRAEDKRWHLRKDTSRFWANGMVMPLKNEDGTLRGFAKVMRDDTTQKLAEDRRRESEEFNRSILESSADCIKVLDLDGHLVSMNRPGLCLMEIDDWSEFEGRRWIDFWHGEEHDKARRAVASAGRGETAGFRGYAETAKGNRKYWDVVVSSILDAAGNPKQILSVSRDITAFKQSEDRLRQSEERFRHMADNAPVMIWVTEADGYCSFLSKSWYEFTGQTVEEGLGFGWVNATHPDDQQLAHDAFVRATERRESFYIEYRLRRTDGSYAWAIDSAVPRFSEDNEFLGFIGSVIDISERKRAEEERERLLESAQAARTTAEEANRLKDEFLATLSHELRTPLNAILGWSQMLQKRSLNPAEAEKGLLTIERNARAQNQLIDDLLDVSRIISGKLRLDVRAVDLAGVIAAAVDAARPSAEAKNIRLQTLLDPAAGPISGDADRLQQVVWNLLSNAVKFTPKNGRVQVRLERVNSHVEIVVSDTGKGIEAEFLPHVFDRFRQSDGSMTRRHGGLGLGLAIVRQIVELHGGTVSVESPGSDQGATFMINLPLLPVRRETVNNEQQLRVHPSARGDGTAASAPELDGVRVLLVDDEADSRDLLNLVLDSCGAVVTTANSAAAALESIKQEKFDVLVSDIGMPEEDGFSLIKKIRNLSDQQGGALPAIALTAYARAEDRVQALRTGFQMHIPKPVESTELIVAVANLAGRIRDLNRE